MGKCYAPWILASKCFGVREMERYCVMLAKRKECDFAVLWSLKNIFHSRPCSGTAVEERSFEFVQ